MAYSEVPPVSCCRANLATDPVHLSAKRSDHSSKATKARATFRLTFLTSAHVAISFLIFLIQSALVH